MKKICSILRLIAWIILLVFWIHYLVINSTSLYVKNITTDYIHYKTYSEETSVEQLKDRLSQDFVNYIIYDNRLTLKDSKYVCFDIAEDGSCKVVLTPEMEACKKLDSNNYSEVKTISKIENAKVYEERKLEVGTKIYTCYNGQYKMDYTSVPSIINLIGVCISCCLFITTAVIKSKETKKIKSVE